MRKNKKLVACAIAMLITALTLTVTTAAADQLSGTWKMNPEKSKYSPGPAPKDLTVVVESDENNYKLDATGTDGDGKPMHVQYSAKFDRRTTQGPASRMPTQFPSSGSMQTLSKLCKRKTAKW